MEKAQNKQTNKRKEERRMKSYSRQDACQTLMSDPTWVDCQHDHTANKHLQWSMFQKLDIQSKITRPQVSM